MTEHNVDRNIEPGVERLVKRAVTRDELDTPLTAYTDAIRAVCAAFSALGPVEIALANATGLVLAEDVVSAVDVPPFSSSSMDGYALKADQTSSACAQNPITLTAVPKIMTGRPLPGHCDAVVPWEDAQDVQDGGDKSTITLVQPVSPGSFVRPIGEDVKAGQVIVEVGTVLQAPHLGLLAAGGRARVRVIPKPQVAVLSTGDELVHAGRALPPGMIYDVNTVMLPALLAAAGATIKHVGMVGDDYRTIADWLHVVAADTDLIVTSGGASVGEHDWLRMILRDEGSLDLWRVALRPGKPFAFGTIDEVPVIVLPGNPASVLACSHAFVFRAIRLLSGREPDPTTIETTLASDVGAPGGRTFLCPVHLDGGQAVPARDASSSVLSNQVGTDGFAIIAPGGLALGDPVRVELWGTNHWRA